MPYDFAGAHSNRTRVLFVSSEVFPLAKTGGLADVSGALPRFIAETGDVDIMVMLPGYPSAIEMLDEPSCVATLKDSVGGEARLMMGLLPGSDLRVIVLDQPDLFRRTGLYTDQNGNDWPDNAARFAAFCHAAVRVATGDVIPSWRADIVHCNDWHTGLIPLLIAALPNARPKTLLTIHNLAFQGNFPFDTLRDLALPEGRYAPDTIEFYGQISFLKAGIMHADRLTTVSPSYAEEILEPEFGMGLEGVLSQRRADLIGILNGIDPEIWNPRNDGAIAAAYSVDDLSGKARCKAELQREWGLDVDPDATLIAFLARLELQKMTDILIDILPKLVERPHLQIAVLGTGAVEFEQALARWPSIAPGRVAVQIGYSEPCAHQLLAAADILLHGSRFEPCGLTQLYALRYGAIPIVNQVGGLRDTTIGATPETIAQSRANAVQFFEPTGAAMLTAIEQALTLRSDAEIWRQMQRAAMRADFSWNRAAIRYRELYQSLYRAPVRRQRIEFHG